MKTDIGVSLVGTQPHHFPDNSPQGPQLASCADLASHPATLAYIPLAHLPILK